MKKYIELTEYDSNRRIVVFADNIQSLCHTHDHENHKDFTVVMVSGYSFMVNEPIDEILKRIERCIKEDEKVMQKINKARAEIIEEKRKNMNMEYDKIFELCILIIDKYTVESEG